MTETTQLGVFAKYWQPGQVKTRLATSVGPQLAAEFHRASLSVVLAEFADFPARRLLAYAPSDRERSFAALGGDAWLLQPQTEGGLGERMRDYFRSGFDAGATKVVLIGSDSPHLRQATVTAAIESLEQSSVAVGPSEDGGYYLVAARPDLPDIFSDIDWSTPRVWPQTVARLEQAKVRWQTLERTFDVDQRADLITLMDHLPPTPQYHELLDVCRRCLAA